MDIELLVRESLISQVMQQNKDHWLHKEFIPFCILVITGSMLIPFVVLIQTVVGDDLNPGVYATDSRPFGISYGEWTFKFWQWVTMIPNDKNPNTDSTGQNCAINQDGPVWFLAPSFGGIWERTCTIPAGKAVLFPVLTGECDYLSSPSVKSQDELLRCASEGNEGLMSTEIDGLKLNGLEKYRVQSPFHNITIPEDNAFGSPPGTSVGVTDGFWVFLEPLSAGNHEIHFKGDVLDNPTTGTQSYSSDVTYHLKVLAAQ